MTSAAFLGRISVLSIGTSTSILLRPWLWARPGSGSRSRLACATPLSFWWSRLARFMRRALQTGARPRAGFTVAASERRNKIYIKYMKVLQWWIAINRVLATIGVSNFIKCLDKIGQLMKHAKACDSISHDSVDWSVKNGTSIFKLSVSSLTEFEAKVFDF